MGGKRIGSGSLEEKSERYVRKQLFRSKFFGGGGLDGDRAERMANIVEATFQRGRTSQEIFVPTVKVLFNKLLENEQKLENPSSDLEKIAANFVPNRSIMPATYKGVSYNPLLLDSGERLDMLDFFSWGKKVQEVEPNFRFLVLDATLYWVVNAVGKMPVEKYCKDAARIAVERFKAELEENKVAKQILEASELRNRYLLAMASLFPNGSCQVVSAKDLWYGNDAYLNALQEAVDFVVASRLEGADFKFAKYAQYSRYNQEYQKWYTPLVLGEAKYLYDAYGISAKLGPTSETAFDSLIRKMIGKEECGFYPMAEMPGFYPSLNRAKDSYDIFWYTRPLERKIPYSEYIFFKDSDSVVDEKLSRNRQLAEWLSEVVKPFVGEVKSKEVAGVINELKNKINRLAENPPAPPSTPGDWWFLWPPGSCG